MDPDDVAHFATFGYVVVRGALDGAALAAEVKAALDDGAAPVVGTGVARVQYLPLMTERTPLSLSLVDALAPWAAALLGGPVLPLRAKGMRYHGATTWHRDADGPFASLGCAAYLEPLSGRNGALRVLPGSHTGTFADDAAAWFAGGGKGVDDVAGVVVDTVPGDVIVFDEHLFHASGGGGQRHQWRVDYVRDPDDDAAADALRAWCAPVFDVAWDGGYDADRYPSYPPLSSSSRLWAARLAALGVVDLAAAQEAAMRARRARR